MAESPRAIRYRTHISAEARAANSPSRSPWPPSSPLPSQPQLDEVLDDPSRTFSHFQRKIYMSWPLDWLTKTLGFVVNGRSAIPRSCRALDEIQSSTFDNSPLPNQTSSTSEPVDPPSDDNSPLNVNAILLRRHRHHHYLISRTHMRRSRPKFHLLHALLFTNHILTRVALTLLHALLLTTHILTRAALTLLSQRILATHFLLLISNTYLTFYKRELLFMLIQILLLGRTGLDELFVGTLLEFVVYLFSQERLELLGYLLRWPSWELVCVDLALWCMPGMSVGEAWEELGVWLDMSVTGTPAKWAYVDAERDGRI